MIISRKERETGESESTITSVQKKQVEMASDNDWDTTDDDETGGAIGSDEKEKQADWSEDHCKQQCRERANDWSTTQCSCWMVTKDNWLGFIHHQWGC